MNLVTPAQINDSGFTANQFDVDEQAWEQKLLQLIGSQQKIYLKVGHDVFALPESAQRRWRIAEGIKYLVIAELWRIRAASSDAEIQLHASDSSTPQRRFYLNAADAEKRAIGFLTAESIDVGPLLQADSAPNFAVV